MSKPEDIPQDVWDAAERIADANEPSTETLARIILTARAEERAACMADLLTLVQRHGMPGAVAENRYVDLGHAVEAIRKRGEA